MRIALVNSLSNRFTPVLARGLAAAGHDVRVADPNTSNDLSLDELASESGVIVSCWADGWLRQIASQRRSARVVSFLRSYEALEPGVIDGVEWQNVDGLIFVAPHVQSYATRAFPQLGAIRQTVIEDAVDLTDFPFATRSAGGKRLGYVGYLNSKKGIPLLVQCLAAAVRLDPQYELHIAGVAQEPRIAHYFRHIVRAAGLTDHVHLHGWRDDVSAFLREVDFLVNTSPWEACPNAVIEAMAAGVKPLVHAWPGAAELFPPECIFATVEEFLEHLRSPEYDSSRYRALVSRRFSTDVQIPRLDAFIAEVTAAPATPLLPVRVSLCMIAGAQSEGAQRQLEMRLGAALESARPWVDEVVVVDTGCGEPSRQILDDFAATCAGSGPVVRIERQPWQGDFALHRNQSLDMATGDWVVILDSDEVIDQASGEALQGLGSVPAHIDALYADLHNDVLGGQTHLLHARLFRRGRVRYSQRVHNVPNIRGGIDKCGLRIIHHGYAEGTEIAAAKTARRIEMCERWVVDEPENATAWTYLAYARLEQRGTLTAALEAAEKAVELHQLQGRSELRLPHAAFPLLSAGMALGRDDDVLRAAQMCLDAQPLYPDPFLFAGYVFAKLGRWQEAFNAAGRFLELQARARIDPSIFVGFENMTYSRTEEALRLLGTAMVKLEDR